MDIKPHFGAEAKEPKILTSDVTPGRASWPFHIAQLKTQGRERSMAMTRGEIARTLARLDATSASVAKLIDSATALATEIDLWRTELRSQVPATSRPSTARLRLVTQDDE